MSVDVVVNAPSFSSIFSSSSFKDFMSCPSVINELVSVTLVIACIFSIIASQLEASWIAILLGSIPLIFPWCDLKSVLLFSMQVNLWSYSCTPLAVRHCI